MAANKRIWTADQDAALRSYYQKSTRGGLVTLSRQWGIAVTTLHSHATRVLGLKTRRHQNPSAWTPAEDQILIEEGYLPRQLLRARLAEAGFPRSEKGLENRRWILRRKGVATDAYRPDLTIAEVAAGLGCTERAVLRWIHCGWLKAKALCPDAPAKRYQITDDQLRRFCIAHPSALYGYQPDLVWYTDLISRPSRGKSHD